MYEDYFGFGEPPFSITPDPRFFYEDNPSCREALAVLCYGVEARKGFVVITGEVGTGKTTLLKAFAESAETTVHTAFVINPKLSVCELLQIVLNDLGIASSMLDRGALTLQLNDYLFEQFEKGHVVALLVDEAQQMSNELLEELRLLSNLETQKDKLIQIVLAGQPELEERLDQPELRQLKQRIALRCRLTPLSGEAVYHYIRARLKIAGADDTDLFDPKAVEKIMLYSGGIPRLINVICDNALLSCYALSKKKVSAEMIEEVASDLRLSAQSPEAPINSEKTAEQNVTEGQREQQGPAKLKDALITGYERSARIPRRRNRIGLRTGLVFGVLILAAIGAIFYSRLSRNAASGIAARGLDEIGRENLALKSRSLQERLPKDPEDLRTLPAGKPLPSTQQLKESGAGSKTSDPLGASKPESFQAADSGDRQENEAEKNVGKDVAKETAAKRPSETPSSVSQMPANDRLRIDVNKAIANRAIRGVEVRVIDGTVVLEGRVATESQKIAAAQAARGVPGVKNVRDQIVVNNDLSAGYDRVPSKQSSGG